MLETYRVWRTGLSIDNSKKIFGHVRFGRMHAGSDEFVGEQIELLLEFALVSNL